MKKITEKEIDGKLMKAGFLCPDYSIHKWKLLDWNDDIRNMKCSKCGNVTAAMAKTLTL